MFGWLRDTPDKRWAVSAFTALGLLATGVPSFAYREARAEQQGGFLDRNGEVAKELSGAACRPPSGQGRLCLVVDNESFGAQVAYLEDGKLRAGQQIPLLADRAKPRVAVVGGVPDVPCPGGRREDRELDGEGIASDGGWFYVTGSHGCSRQNARFRTSIFTLARVRLDEGGNLDTAGGQDPLQLTYRLADVLREAARTAALRPESGSSASYFGRALDDSKDGRGLNVEGIAVVGGRVLVGLRAPSLNGKAFVVGAPAADLFAPGQESRPIVPSIHEIELGMDAGIRDMTSLREGWLLVLSGPAQEQPGVPYRLSAVSLTDWQVRPLEPALPFEDTHGRNVNAEAVVVLAASDTTVRVLVLFDGLPNGGPREYTVHFPERR